MLILRLVICLELISCVVLLVFKKLGSEQMTEYAFLPWLFIFAYPFAYISLLIGTFLFAFDLYQYKKAGNAKSLSWGLFDISVPILGYFIFETYYGLIGHM